MKNEDRELLRKARKYVESHYPSDFPYYVQFIMDKFYELKNSHDAGR